MIADRKPPYDSVTLDTAGIVRAGGRRFIKMAAAMTLTAIITANRIAITIIAILPDVRARSILS